MQYLQWHENQACRFRLQRGFGHSHQLFLGVGLDLWFNLEIWAYLSKFRFRSESFGRLIGSSRRYLPALRHKEINLFRQEVTETYNELITCLCPPLVLYFLSLNPRRRVYPSIYLFVRLFIHVLLTFMPESPCIGLQRIFTES